MIITTSSVRSLLAALLRNRRPRIGMSPIPGIFCIVVLIWLFSSPAIANVWPSRSSSSVSVRRLISAGMRKPSRCTPFAKSSVLTSGRTRRRMRSPCTTGTKFRRTPNSLNCTVIALPPPGCVTGIGNSPPARKLASLPLSATRFGSARLWNRPRVCSARITVPRSFFVLKRNRFRKSPNVSFPSSNSGALNCCVVVRPTQLSKPLGLVKNDAPSSVIADRLTSANRTFSSTWLLDAFCTRSSDTTSSLRSTNPPLRLMIWSAISFFETTPDRTTSRPLLVTATASFGNSCLSCSASLATSRATITS